MRSRLFPSLLIAAFLAACFLTAARAEDGVTTIKFSDPAKPGTLKVALGHGNVRITGTDATEVSVKSSAKPVSKAKNKDGLRVLTAATSFGLAEKDNVVMLDAISESFKGNGADFTLTIPRNTRVIIQSSWGGDIACNDISGDLEIKNTNGSVRLDGIRGGVLVETMNGDIRANIAELRDGKPLSFTSMNSEIVLRVPNEAKASVRLRTQNGSVLTDFDETALVTKTESAPRPLSSSRRSTTGVRPPKAPAAPVAPVGPEAPNPKPAPAAAPAKPALDAETKEEIREAARVTAEAAREAAREAVAATKEAVQAVREGFADANWNWNLNIKMPTMPVISGGNLVTGTLNGGGPEISVATMNGDIKLLQLEKK
ncbi:MAG: DUF4097 family beta strand repeat-containing protein [Verrucomicrobia bacterium]|nr:DUF4097 family beta strand repeat-containing protein [Verrucomicrobiota bacterium]